MDRPIEFELANLSKQRNYYLNKHLYEKAHPMLIRSVDAKRNAYVVL